MNLYRLKINGLPFEETQGYEVADLNGLTPYVLANNNPSIQDYDDITSIENYHLLGAIAGLDFQQVHGILFMWCLAVGFSNLTLVEQDIIAEYCASDDTTLVTHYATTQTAGDLVSAKIMHSARLGVVVEELTKIANIRAFNPKIKEYVGLYFEDRVQVDLFMAAIRNFLFDYTFKFHLGTQYGDSTDGILDYIERTGGYSGVGQGLDGYTFCSFHKQRFYDEGGAVLPNSPTVTEQENAHNYVRDLLTSKLVAILRDGDFS